RARQLAADGLSSAAIAERLNAEGYRPPKRRERFGAQGVRDLLQRLGAQTTASRLAPARDLGAHEWGLRELAHEIGMPHVTLYNWVGRGWVTARRDTQTSRCWILWADAAEVERLRQRHRRSLGDERHRDWYPATLLAPDHETDILENAKGASSVPGKPTPPAFYRGSGAGGSPPRCAARRSPGRTPTGGRGAQPDAPADPGAQKWCAGSGAGAATDDTAHSCTPCPR